MSSNNLFKKKVTNKLLAYKLYIYIYIYKTGFDFKYPSKVHMP